MSEAALRYRTEDLKPPGDLPQYREHLERYGMRSPDRDSYQNILESLNREGAIIVVREVGHQALLVTLHAGDGHGYGLLSAYAKSPEADGVAAARGLRAGLAVEQYRDNKTAEMLRDLPEWLQAQVRAELTEDGLDRRYSEAGFCLDAICALRIKHNVDVLPDILAEEAGLDISEASVHRAFESIHSVYSYHRLRDKDNHYGYRLDQTSIRYLEDTLLGSPSDKWDRQFIREFPWHDYFLLREGVFTGIFYSLTPDDRRLLSELSSQDFKLTSGALSKANAILGQSEHTMLRDVQLQENPATSTKTNWASMVDPDSRERISSFRWFTPNTTDDSGFRVLRKIDQQGVDDKGRCHDANGQYIIHDPSDDSISVFAIDNGSVHMLYGVAANHAYKSLVHSAWYYGLHPAEQAVYQGKSEADLRDNMRYIPTTSHI